MDKYGDIISIHAPHEGERLWLTLSRTRVRGHFNPRSPRGGATRKQRRAIYPCWPISIHAPHEGERLNELVVQSAFNAISIHAPHEGERRVYLYMTMIPYDISIHAPHEGERHTQTRVIKAQERFQSTLPTRGSDASLFSTFDLGLYFNPRSPRGGATSSADTTSSSARFNPRSPRGGATLINDLSEQICEVSIHAPHEGERPLNPDVRNYHRCFNPRSPRGGATMPAQNFYST